MTNVDRLIIYKMSILAVPNGGGLGSAIDSIVTPGRLQEHCSRAREWVERAIQEVRLAADPNPWKEASDEAIAGEILRHVETRMASQKREDR